jgi:1-acyl-sn-glycerol-3-phosphate acyltransferase
VARRERLRGPARVLAILARIIAFITAPFVRYDIRKGCAEKLSVGVVAANHRSMFDVAAGLVCLHRLGHYPRLLIEKRYVESGWTGPAARAIGAIPVDRSGAKGASLEHAFAALRDGIPVLVMPEGRLHWDPEHPLSTGPAKSGVSRLAVGGHVAVVPVGLSGTERVMPAGAKLPRFVPFRRKVVVCQVAEEPLWFDGEDHEANTAVVMAAIEDLLALAGRPAR